MIGLSAADLKLLDDGIARGLELIASGGTVMLVVAAVGFASVAVVRARRHPERIRAPRRGRAPRADGDSQPGDHRPPPRRA